MSAIRVIDDETGKSCVLDMTPELRANLDAHYAADCKHPEREIRQRTVGAGALHFYHQCVTCGASVGQAIKKSPELADAPAWNTGLQRRYVAIRETDYQAIIQRHVRKQKSGDEGFKRKYDIYLSSPTWQAKRAKVLKRAGGICEGCLERRATQVHHLTYAHIFEEFMFELIAICDECHARLHEEKDGEAPADGGSEWEDGHPCEGCRHSSEHENRRWCFILNEYAADALAPGGDCGPEHVTFEPLR